MAGFLNAQFRDEAEPGSMERKNESGTEISQTGRKRKI
jgi:hypothetical protein